MEARMKNSLHRSSRKAEAGIALLLSIFVLLVISVVAIALIVSSGTESALAGNYRTSASSYYAALAGLEEARGRLLPKNPNFFNNTVANFIPQTGTAMAVGQVRYILNPASGETVNPTGSATSQYPDAEYATENGSALSSATVQTITSTSALASSVTPPLYKWVRITAATERNIAGDSVGRDVNGDSAINNTIPIFYDTGVSPARLVVTTTPSSTAQPVYKITALAVLPNRSEKLLQYTVAAKTFNLNLPSALTNGSNNIAFSGASSNPYMVNGQDGSGNPPPVAGCTPNGANSVQAIGATNSGDVTSIINGIPSNRVGNYTGLGGSIPNVGLVSLSQSLDTPADAYKTVQMITSAADLVIPHDATNADLPSGMSASNPMVVVVDGNFSMTGNFTGYGLLVVTGNFAYTGNTGWKGIVLVVGDGTTTYDGSGGGNNEFDGAIYVSTIWDSSHNLLSTFGPVGYDISGGGGNGIYYNSCWIKNAQQPATYTVLSFREIPYNN
jgi:hypothetical protein